MYYLTIREHIDAAHSLRGYKGACANLHGHTWIIELTVKGHKLDELGILTDFKHLKMILVTRTGHRFDHKCWNNHEPFDKINPTAENIARYVYDDVVASGLLSEGISVDNVKVWESEKACAIYKEEK